jgi:Peptide N-acetyl-beta-D-glucosaminyl asparaginase amidase A
LPFLIPSYSQGVLYLLHGGVFTLLYNITSQFEEVCRPITAYGALDLPTYHLDLTPFIPVLTDGKPHNITLDVASAESSHRINQNWFVSGLLQVKLDPSSLHTTGQITRYEASNFATSNASASVSGKDVNITVTASRNVYIEAEIIGGSGARTEVVFTQALQYENVQNYLQNFTVQVRRPGVPSSSRVDVS